MEPISPRERVTRAITRIRNRIANIIASSDRGAIEAERDAAKAETNSIVTAIETFADEIAPIPVQEALPEPPAESEAATEPPAEEEAEE